MAGPFLSRGPLGEIPEVWIVTRGNVTFIINHTAQGMIVRLGREGKAVLGSFRAGAAELPPYGVCIVQ